MNHASLYCLTLAAVPIEDAINAAHQALMQLEAIGPRCEGKQGQTIDNAPAIAALRRLMEQAGHIGFAP